MVDKAIAGGLAAPRGRWRANGMTKFVQGLERAFRGPASSGWPRGRQDFTAANSRARGLGGAHCHVARYITGSIARWEVRDSYGHGVRSPTAAHSADTWPTAHATVDA